jgi:internalin A
MQAHVTEIAAKVEGSECAPPLTFAQEPAAKPEYFVSYALRDDTPESKERESIVDQLCAAAEERGITILRDKNVLGLGDRISKFMQCIGRGNRVFIVLSDKYLKSPYCMYELYELWRNCRQDNDEFLSHVKVYTLPGTAIWSPLDRAKCAAYWRDESGKPRYSKTMATVFWARRTCRHIS